MTIVHCTKEFPWKWTDQVSKVQHHDVIQDHTSEGYILRCVNCGYETKVETKDDDFTAKSFTV